LELQNFSKVYPNISNSVEKRTKLIYSESETEEKSDMEITLENKEVDGIYKNMIPCKIDRVNIRCIYNFYLIIINNIVVYGFR
jgi:hypothetical protein